MPAETPVLEIRGGVKRFGPVVANDRISLSLRAGEIHALLGENGAGKTTLLNLFSGMYQPDAGEILVDGRPVRIPSPADALALGIGTVYQHFTLVPNMTVIENIMLSGGQPFVLDLNVRDERLTQLLSDFGLAGALRSEVRYLSLGERQRVEIVKALYRGSRVLLLDEPTSVLSPSEVDELFEILRGLKADGVAVVLITHKLEEALAISDRVTVLRQSRVVGELGTDDLTSDARDHARQRVVTLMFGGTPPREVVAQSHAFGSALLSMRGVRALGDRGEIAVRDVDLDLVAGEIFGIAGVDGNGQKELAEAIAGQRHVASGKIVAGGLEITNRGAAAATKAGIGYVTDDRLGEGVIGAASVADNTALKAIGRAPFSNGFWVHRRAIDAHAQRLIAQFEVKTPATSTRAGLLSGGNMQKLLLARELALNPTVIVCNKPTQGLDLKTARFVLQTLRAEANTGKAVILISSELDELLEMSDRIGVMFNGRFAAILEGAEATVETIGALMLGGAAKERAQA
ncbi:MAG: ABC transporter ATP-binding protein [Thermomicrobiales bacterium]